MTKGEALTSVLQGVTNQSAKPPLVIHLYRAFESAFTYNAGEEREKIRYFLDPVTMKCFPSGVFLAVVRNPATSLPANASEMANEMS